MKSKNQIADDEYGCDFDELTGGEKAAITKKYNKQSPSRRTRRAAPVVAGVKATIGRVGVNGTKTCLLVEGATISDLLSQSGYDFDTKKEGIVAESTGNSVSLSDEAVHNETYAIAPEIKSA